MDGLTVDPPETAKQGAESPQDCHPCFLPAVWKLTWMPWMDRWLCRNVALLFIRQDLVLFGRVVLHRGSSRV